MIASKFLCGVGCAVCLMVSFACLRPLPGLDLSPLALLGASSSSSGGSSSGSETYAVGGSVSGLTGVLVLIDNATGETLSITADGAFVFSTAYVDGASYNVTVQSLSGTQQCYVNSNNGTVAAADVSLTVNCFSQFVDLANPPSVTMSVPGSGATGQFPCFGNPCRSRVVFRFNETMDTSVIPIVTGQIEGLGTPVSILSRGFFAANFVNDSLAVELSWGNYPENSHIQLSLNAGSVQDLDTTPQNMVANFVFSFNTGTGHFYRIPASGQTQCSDGTTVSACPHGVFGQDGDYSALPVARTYSAPNNFVFASDYITTDQVTGLDWTTCPLGQTYSTGSCTGTPQSSTWNGIFTFCAALNSANAGAGYAGLRGWRLPTLRELRTITDYGAGNPPWNNAAFSPTAVAGDFWTATVNSTSSAQAFSWSGSNGVEASSGKSSSFAARCVRGGGGFPGFVDNGNETVTDSNTGLVWMKCTFGRSDASCTTGTPLSADVDTAIASCEGHSLAGRNDWRLPGVHELQTIVDFSSANPPSFGPFQTEAGVYVTSSGQDAVTAWSLDFTGLGLAGSRARTAPGRYRCVAGP